MSQVGKSKGGCLMALLAESFREQKLLPHVERQRPILTSPLIAPQGTNKRGLGEPLAVESQSVQPELVSVVLPKTAMLLRQPTDTALGSGLVTRGHLAALNLLLNPACHYHRVWPSTISPWDLIQLLS